MSEAYPVSGPQRCYRMLQMGLDMPFGYLLASLSSETAAMKASEVDPNRKLPELVYTMFVPLSRRRHPISLHRHPAIATPPSPPRHRHPTITCFPSPPPPSPTTIFPPSRTTPSCPILPAVPHPIPSPPHPTCQADT